ncbi:Chromatin assembly factor 1 subunit A [Cinnamomum micranthum f. kanehirae]|uniref:Chromatin assembly factor 1 subunit A n=1 Tax=Cinnamomum micranthum f. kanehirae TaxID=337451 RepID=A0A3S3N1W4_9MAGN|nr:Chromatin assembly factor 1 subunit A [Cinnamomum micranthum f. kanehirae]
MVAMVDLVVIDGSPAHELRRLETDPKTSVKSVKKSLKRKRALFDENVNGEENESVISGYRQEIVDLFRYFKDVLAQKVHLEDIGYSSSNSVIACLLEESCLPFSKLVDDVYEKLKLKEGVTLASVRSSVLFVGQRSMYGIGNADADVLEDDSESCLWCWETRDMKLLPKAQRGILNIRRIHRKKIHERITALSSMISMLSMPKGDPNYKLDLKKASEKLGKALNEVQIRSLVQSLLQKNDTDMVQKEAKLKEKELVKEMEKNKREIEKEKKRMDRELQKEKWQSEREQKRLQDEAEKEEKRREKEESELKKQLKRQQEEAEKDRRRREKEEIELKRGLALQKQVSIMERFLKSKSDYLGSQDKRLSMTASELVNPVTLSMDCALSQKDVIDTHDFLRTHLVAWHKLSPSICHNIPRWGVRRKPKVALFTELKLQGSSLEAEPSGRVTTPCIRHACSEVKDRNDLSLQKQIDGWEQVVGDDSSCHNNIATPLPNTQFRNKPKKLLQFDKSHRPAYYGTFGVVGPRKPFKKDPDLDYDIESDEEWEEEDPGESLSDCDKDDEEENLEEGNQRAEDEDASEDSFMVPDGYLSENEGVQIDCMASDAADDEVRSSPSCMQEVENEEFRVLLRQQKYLHDLTEHALRRNQPLIISNLTHEKAALIMSEDLNGNLKLEQICLQALSMRLCPGGTSIELSADPVSSTEDKEFCQSQERTKSNTPPAVPAAAIPDLDMHEVVCSIQSCPYGMKRVVQSLQKTFPGVAKTHLRRKVQEVSTFVDNRWQVKKEVLDKLGLSISPEKNISRNKGIATFFSKRCLPPVGETINVAESSPQSCCKSAIHLDEPEYVDKL